ncbi:Helix-turn-helix protein [Bernardetia litoralis DSM 6794]|uniref:Helix-turn-helix protein n=1 Tax=Bernardetia litoralis (strain ATCC 23117 / DSM 6794 / NBRC 15988 / NCIMB 1366 / Fx l1 / Sio-4) TaxID=880071 RepID=I4ALM6_BERLS|nr:helix-turn-helix transcriptional regulator [Bernardetia litoralis]AFM04861.1 Helix-turn-helix protein [Bernardetia litoralis DSM 6794]
MAERPRMDKLNIKTMKQDYKKIIEKGFIENELELERTFILERKLRLLIPKNPNYKEDRKQLRSIIKEYEKQNWSTDSIITDKKIKESDYAEQIAEQERQFLAKRKEIIKTKLLENKLNQQDLGAILKHSKSYISELMNGINSFTKKDLIIIHKLFDIKLEDLIPTTITQKDVNRMRKTIEKLGKNDLISKLYSSKSSHKVK